MILFFPFRVDDTMEIQQCILKQKLPLEFHDLCSLCNAIVGLEKVQIRKIARFNDFEFITSLIENFEQYYVNNDQDIKYIIDMLDIVCKEEAEEQEAEQNLDPVYCRACIRWICSLGETQGI